MIPAFPLSALAVAAFACIGGVRAAEYPQTESHSGTSFFDGFRFPAEAYDNTTSGDTFWATAQNTSLLYVNDGGRVILKVDNTSFVPYNEKRYAPKILSKNTYGPGTVWVMDAVHVPYGCSVWGAWWTQGPNWPAGGEIDIFEGIHLRKENMMALHTDGSVAQCTIDKSKQMTGRVDAEDCDQSVNFGSGCTVFDQNENSYGEAFAKAGGGVFVTEWSTEAIRLWFITRSAVPSTLSVSAETIDTSTLGTPVAEYSSSTCNIEKLFERQTLTLNIALCGTFAGLPSLLEETCPALVGDKTCYTTYVIDDASATYANAYFELNYVNVYSTESATGNATTPSGIDKATTTVTAGVGGQTAGVNSTVAGGSSGAGRVVVGGLAGVAGVAGAVAVGLGLGLAF